ncbi:hypothetical protein NJC38_07415 [Pseudomonas sp. 21LCFQ010]|uniref:hypothetical protein n=1 Tax=Pseudomonas sp. 21LCFQ010 TaxID=2957506 RepID=UPI0020973A5F|nr:hypothetical protein [Pseudomonas sp. 21LCFQ010]MCO8161985.1 hypothetical protein [Pseudomonas sp. 21LCFQ010]
MHKAWIENGVVRDIAVDPDSLFHPDVAALFTADVPESVVVGSTLVDGQWIPPVPVADEPPIVLAQAVTKVSPVEFKLLFTGPERVGIKKLRVDDALLDDFMSIVDDGRLGFVDMSLKSTRDGVGYALQALASDEVIPADTVERRAAEILTGVFQ